MMHCIKRGVKFDSQAAIQNKIKRTYSHERQVKITDFVHEMIKLNWTTN